MDHDCSCHLACQILHGEYMCSLCMVDDYESPAVFAVYVRDDDCYVFMCPEHFQSTIRDAAREGAQAQRSARPVLSLFRRSGA